MRNKTPGAVLIVTLPNEFNCNEKPLPGRRQGLPYSGLWGERYGGRRGPLKLIQLYFAGEGLPKRLECSVEASILQALRKALTAQVF